MPRADQQVAQEIVDALQSRIGQWQAEIQSIDLLRSKQDRKEARYQMLLDLIDAAQAEIDKAQRKLDNAQSNGK
jgi:hypothetical protein